MPRLEASWPWLDLARHRLGAATSRRRVDLRLGGLDRDPLPCADRERREDGAGEGDGAGDGHRLAERVDEVLRGRRSAKLAVPTAPWKIAPVTATPRLPPTMRNIESTPEAIPAFSTGTAFIAALVIGDIVIAMPMPSSMKPGSRSR